MNQKVLLIVVVIVLIAAGAWYVTQGNKTKVPPAMSVNSEETPSQTSTAMDDVLDEQLEPIDPNLSLEELAAKIELEKQKIAELEVKKADVSGEAEQVRARLKQAEQNLNEGEASLKKLSKEVAAPK
ncbi:MAG: hypothetical protein H0W44_08225 [Gammaproteobacteria bacterium]|nr:hypothetical protein [Gammaproteobacteria bacterium]